MSAELVDPLATPKPEPLLTPDEWVAIRDEIHDRPWDDPSRFPELIQEALKTLGEIGLSNTPDPAREATQCLRRLVYRAHVGAWRHDPETEPVFPACTSKTCAQTALMGSCHACQILRDPYDMDDDERSGR